MSASGGISQLLKGIIIGVVLIMAVIGAMTLLDKENPLSTFTGSDQNTATIQDSNVINSPSITLNPNNTDRTVDSNNTNKIGDLNADIVEDQTTAIVESSTLENKPVLENERTADPTINKQPASIEFGMMELASINAINKQSLKASYTVYDKNNAKVASSTDSTNAAYRLPTGQYKVETTLIRKDEATNQNIPVLTKSRYMIVRPNSTSRQTFELEPPANTGVLQVSANVNKQNVRANFIIQKANGETVASRNNVTNSLFKLEVGTYKVSVSSGNNKDFRSIEVKAGESIQTIFDLKQVNIQGKLLVRVFEMGSSNPIRADIKITSADGSVIQDLKATTQSELNLAQGNYKIAVVGPNGTSNRNIRVNPQQTTNEIFRFDLPSNTTAINDNVVIKPVENNQTPAETNTDASKVSLNILVQDQNTKKPIKSNVYIQNLKGEHLDKKTYVDSASFNLDPGVYKVTVRSQNRENNVKTIRISNNQNVTETFLMVNPNAAPAIKQPPKVAVKPAKPDPVTPPPSQAIPTGFLNITMRAPQGNRADLRSDFVVSKANGQKIVELKSVPVGNFKLDIGAYDVTAIRNNRPVKRRINIRPNQNTRLNFNVTEFAAPKGTLQSRIVNASGRPLKGNLVVRNMRGRVVARANNVSNAVFNLPPVRHTISVDYQGLIGNETVEIVPNETTVQTFTIAANNNNLSNNAPRDIREVLKEKIKKEIQRNF